VVRSVRDLPVHPDIQVVVVGTPPAERTVHFHPAAAYPVEVESFYRAAASMEECFHHRGCLHPVRTSIPVVVQPYNVDLLGPFSDRQNLVGTLRNRDHLMCRTFREQHLQLRLVELVPHEFGQGFLHPVAHHQLAVAAVVVPDESGP